MTAVNWALGWAELLEEADALEDCAACGDRAATADPEIGVALCRRCLPQHCPCCLASVRDPGMCDACRNGICLDCNGGEGGRS